MNRLRFGVAVVFVVVSARGLRADSLVSATGTFTSFPSGFDSATPTWTGNQEAAYTSGAFWNNTSAKVGEGGSHDMNIGYLLNDSGGYMGTPAVLGSDSVTGYLSDSGADPAAWDFLSTGNSYDLSLLFASSDMATGNAATGITFGYYSGNSYNPIYTPVATDSPTGPPQLVDPTTAGNTFGFYATVCYEDGCETYTSGNGNSGSVDGAAGWNHLALFQLASGSYVIAFEDAASYDLEGFGDFSDTDVELTELPEPSSFALTAVALVCLAFVFRRFYSRRA